MTTEAVVHEFAAMITPWAWLLIALVWVGLHTVQERFSEFFAKPKLGWRLLPFIPSCVCAACCFVPGPWIPESSTAAIRVLFGAMLGVIAYNFGGIANRLGLNKLLDAIGIKMIVEKTKRKEPVAADTEQGEQAP